MKKLAQFMLIFTFVLSILNIFLGILNFLVGQYNILWLNLSGLAVSIISYRIWNKYLQEMGETHE